MMSIVVDVEVFHLSACLYSLAPKLTAASSKQPECGRLYFYQTVLASVSSLLVSARPSKTPAGTTSQLTAYLIETPAWTRPLYGEEVNRSDDKRVQYQKHSRTNV